MSNVKTVIGVEVRIPDGTPEGIPVLLNLMEFVEQPDQTAWVSDETGLCVASNIVEEAVDKLDQLAELLGLVEE